jgi:hypothetical protein
MNRRSFFKAIAAAVGGATTKLLSLPKGITDLGKPAAAIPFDVKNGEWTTITIDCTDQTSNNTILRVYKVGPDGRCEAVESPYC